MQVVSAGAAVQMLSPNKQRKGSLQHEDKRRRFLTSEYKSLNTGILVRDSWHSLLKIPLFCAIV